MPPPEARAERLGGDPGPVAAASVLYVDADASAGVPPDECPGDGSEASPFRSIDCAFASGAIRAGTSIQLRDADIPYEGADSAGHALTSGGLSDPVVIEPAPGHAPILVGTLALDGLSHWVIRDLVFDGSGGGAPSSEAIRVSSTGGEASLGVEIEGVTIRQWPGRGIVLRGSPSLPLVGTIVRDSRIEGARDAGLWLENVAAARIANNEIAQLDCVAYSPFTLCDECGADACALCGDCLGEPLETCGATSEHEIGGQIGVRVLGESFDVELVGNYLHDFLDDDCGVEGTRTAALFITGQLAHDSTISQNLIERIAPGNPDNGYGILMYQSASGWTVERNVLTDIGHCALCEGDWLFYGSEQTRWLHNTIIGVEGSAIDIRRAAEVEVRGNLVVDAPLTPVRVWAEGVDELVDFDHNVYWGGDFAVGSWGDEVPLSLSSWQDACMCDASSASEDPGLPPPPPFDPTPAADGPAIDLVPPVDSRPFHGAAHDAGALEAPVPLDARITNGAPGVVRLRLENEFAPPLRGFEGCVGFSVEADGVPLPIDSCAVADDELQIELVDPAVGGTAVTLAYAGGSVTDSAAIGGRLGARLRPFAIDVLNDAPFPSADDTAGDSDGSGTVGQDGGTEDAGDEGIDCSCRSAAPRWPGALAWLLLLVGRRRGARAVSSAGC